MVPAQVFPGESLGAKRGPPIRLPQIKAPVSVAQTISSMPITTSEPCGADGAAPPATRRAMPR